MQSLFIARHSNFKSVLQSSQKLSSNLHYSSTRSFAFQQFDTKKNYYKVLDISEKSSASDIKKAFYKLAKQYHPDVNKGNADRFKEINEAYEVLGDDFKRKDYDSLRKHEASSSSTSSSSGYSSYSNTGYSNTNRNASNNRQNTSNSNQQYQYYYRDPNGNPYSNNTQYQSQEETLKNYFRQFGQTSKQWHQFEEEMKKKEKSYHNSNVNQNKNRSSYDSFFGTENMRSSGYDRQNEYRKMQEDIFKNYKDEEYKRMEEMERLRRKKEEEFMRDAEKKFNEFMGKVDGAKKFVKNVADNLSGLWKSK